MSGFRGMTFERSLRAFSAERRLYSRAQLDAAVAEAVRREREACAQVVDRNAEACRANSELHDVLSANAIAIRARGAA